MSDGNLASLNPNQLKAATTIDRHVRIIAGAGSGKTRVLMSRIAYLVQTCGILPWRIMAITFTNKAAREMKERLSDLLQDQAEDVKISTIHSLCVRMLREDGNALGYPKSFTIVDADDQKSLLRPIYKELEVDRSSISNARALSYISNCKSADITPEKAAKIAYDADSEMLSAIYSKYQARLDEMKAMDFDDLLLNGRNLLKEVDEVREKWQNRLDYIHVDEFQDVDPVQYEIIRLLCAKDTRLCVVGDPDQTIYTWRGASVEIIMRFNKDFPDTETIILNENYRSTQPILNAANALIVKNQNRIEKDLFTQLPGDDLVEEYEGEEDSDEALYITRQIMELHRKGYNYDDMAILYRSNYLSRSVERVLRTTGIPYRIFGGIRFYERAEIKDILSYLKLLCMDEVDPLDPANMSVDLSVLRIINQPKRGIGVRTIDKLSSMAAERQCNLYETILHPEGFTRPVKAKLAAFTDVIEELKSDMASCELEEIIDIILEKTGYADMVRAAREEERLENIEELKQDIFQARQSNPDLTLASYLQDISLMTDRTEAAAEQSGGVTLMTAHSSKGLEFPIVFVSGMNDGVFPSQKALDDSGSAGLEEERRLLYVAMTRAKERLYLTWNTSYSFYAQRNKVPSRFIGEIPDEFIRNEKKEDSLKAQAAKSAARSSSNSFAMHAQKRGKKQPVVRLRPGDQVEHSAYGRGVVISVNGNIASITFGKDIGIKKLNAQHKAITKL
jgi:DNA helicase-2/ATP-dependent DNA helicase PcrA